MKIITAEQEHMYIVRDLFREYQDWVEADCCFQDFETELANLPGLYEAPKGIILLAFDENNPVACAAVKPTRVKPETEAEIKRLFVKDTYRGHGIGKKLFSASLDKAKQIGYEAVVIETLPKMEAAQFMYRDFGFETIPNYAKNADDGVICYRYCFDKKA